MYALVDCNSFFASCEQIFRPDLRCQPVVVLSNNDGCIVARSQEAKILQVPNLQPYFKIKQLLEEKNVHVFSSNYELYGDISNRVMQTLQGLAPTVEVYSIDESFLCLDGFNQDLNAYGETIKRQLWRDIRMPVCTGFGQTKTLAKLANHIAKKSKKLRGVCVLSSLSDWDAVFKKLPVSVVWGVGSRLTKRLRYLDIQTVYALKNAPTKMIRKHFSVNVERTIAELNGERCLTLGTQPQHKQQIYSTRSFGQKVQSLTGLQQAVSQYAATAAVKLRKQGSLVKTVSVFIETSRFAQEVYRNNRTVQLHYPTNDTRTITHAVSQAVSHMYQSGYSYAKAGVGLIEILDTNPCQLNFFDQHQSNESQALMAVVDELNKRQQQVFFASSGIDPFWKMQRKMKSPSYTTSLNEIPFIKM